MYLIQMFGVTPVIDVMLATNRTGYTHDLIDPTIMPITKPMNPNPIRISLNQNMSFRLVMMMIFKDSLVIQTHAHECRGLRLGGNHKT